MIVNLRGCSGSGKSHVGFRLLQEFGPGVDFRRSAFRRKKPTLLGHELAQGIFLAGRYVIGKSPRLEGAGYTGGLDGFYPMDELQALVEEFCSQHQSVFFESLLISGTFQRWDDFAKKFPGRVAFVYLDTPLDLCIQRVLARNGGRPIKEHLIDRHRHQTLRTAEKFIRSGETVSYVSTEGAYDEVKKWLLTPAP